MVLPKLARIAISAYEASSKCVRGRSPNTQQDSTYIE
jgi:hypothetical protein